MPVNMIGWNQILMYVIETMFKIAVTVAIPYLFTLLRVKLKNDTQIKYLDKFEKLIVDAVGQVQQTYVENMKAEGLFDKNAQKDAFNMVKTSVLNMMNERMQEIIFDSVGDFDEYLTSKIEAEVFKIKQGTAKADA